MNRKFVYLAKRLMINISYPVQMGILTLMACLFALMTSCTTNRTGVGKGQPLRLSVGEIKEVSLSTRADTTWQLTATSDNQEMVDVSRKSSAQSIAGQAVFLIKGVTIGRANVVFSENQVGTAGNGQIKKTYTVTVVSK